MKLFDPKRAKETARRLRAGDPATPLVDRETIKRPGDVLIFADRVEVM